MKNQQIIEDFSMMSHSKLEKRGKLVGKEDYIESIREWHTSSRRELKNKFLIEVDRAVEEKNQNIANRRYHEFQTEMAVPYWITKLMDARIVAVSLGHNPALRWRSRTKKILEEVVAQAEVTDLSDEFKKRLRHLLQVNLYSPSHFCSALKQIHDDYMRENSTNDSTLGRHSKAHLQALKEREGKQTLVPLAASEWSKELSSGAVTANSAIWQVLYSFLFTDLTVWLKSPSLSGAVAVVEPVDLLHGACSCACIS